MSTCWATTDQFGMERSRPQCIPAVTTTNPQTHSKPTLQHEKKIFHGWVLHDCEAGDVAAGE